MVTQDQITSLSQKYRINEQTIVREYFQLVFLQHFYRDSKSRQVFFKGGTAVHILFKAPRFSEDLDFTVNMPEEAFMKVLDTAIRSLQQQESIQWKERKTITGRRFLLICTPVTISYPVYLNLDFSFRETVLSPQQSIVEATYPVLFTNYVHHLSGEEIAAEKIRALMTRRKGRDLYDLWYLLTKNISLQSSLVQKKLAYYNLADTSKQTIVNRIASFPEHDFIMDVRPFIPTNERNKLTEFFRYVKDYIEQKL